MTEKEKRAIEIFQSNRGDHKGNEAWVRHYLYMDRALDAKRLGSRLANDGFRIKVKRSGDGEKWLVLVTHRISVEESSIQTFRDFLESAVAEFKGGEYDGWEAEV